MVEKQMQTQLLVFSIEFSHLCEALAEQIQFVGTAGSKKQWNLCNGFAVGWMLSRVPSNHAALHEQKGATLIFDLGPDLVYHRKMLQDCWLECRAAIGCAALNCLRVRMFEHAYLFRSISIISIYSYFLHNTNSYIM